MAAGRRPLPLRLPPPLTEPGDIIQLLQLGPTGVRAAFDGSEVLAANDALNEVCNGISLSDDDFARLIGVERSTARSLLARFHDSFLSLRPDTEGADLTSGELADLRIVLVLSCIDLQLLSGALREVCDGVHIPDWEFTIRVSVSRADMERLLAAVDAARAAACGEDDRGAAP